MNIILFGPPGAGKGTQGNNIVHFFNLHKVSSGDLLRSEIKNSTKIGLKIKSIIDNGLLVSDDIINNLIEDILKDKNISNRLIFDGYPRNLDQAKKLSLLLKKYKQNISAVFSLNVSKEKVIKRILGRQTCTKCGLIFNEYFNPSTQDSHKCGSKFLIKRSDDSKEIIIKRFETYIDKTLPLLNYYKDQNLLHELNGSDEIDHIFKEIQGIIASLEGWLVIRIYINSAFR